MSETSPATTTPAAVEPTVQEKTTAPTTVSGKITGDEVPSQATLDKAYNLDVLDKDGKAVKFGTLVQQTEQRMTVVVFVRHFFCGSCREYIRALSRDLSPSTLASLSPPPKLIVIGCGDPKLMPAYAESTDCTFDMYADPTRKLYDAFGFVISYAIPKERPAYIRVGLAASVMTAIKDAFMAGTGAVKGGKKSQNGGEIVWLDGQCRFLSRMKNTQDHLETGQLRAVLEAMV